MLGLPVGIALPTVREPQRRGLQTTPAADVDAVGISCYAMMTNGLQGWIPTFLMRTYGSSPADVGVQFGLVLLVFGTLGTAWGGFRAVWLRKRGHTDANMRLSIMAALLILPFGIAAPLMPTGSSR